MGFRGSSAGWALAGLLLLAPVAWAGGDRSRAQEGQTPAGQELLVPVVLVSGVVDPGGAETLSVATVRLVLSPGQASLPLVARGAVFMVVLVGGLRVESDAPLLPGQSPDDGLGPPFAADLEPGGTATVRPGATVSVRNDGAEPAALIVLSVVPEAG